VAEERSEQTPEERAARTPGPGRPVGDVGAPDEDPGDVNADATPEIGDDDQDKEKTTQPAPEDDAGT
jgi:hypothetical protein